MKFRNAKLTLFPFTLYTFYTSPISNRNLHSSHLHGLIQPLEQIFLILPMLQLFPQSLLFRFSKNFHADFLSHSCTFQDKDFPISITTWEYILNNVPAACEKKLKRWIWIHYVQPQFSLSCFMTYKVFFRGENIL